MAGMYQYNWRVFREMQRVKLEGAEWDWIPTVGKAWMHITMEGKVRATTPVVSYDKESGVVVTQNSVYVRG